MEDKIIDSDISRGSATENDTARHPLTITQTAELFAQLGVPRSKRSVQRFCEQGHLDCVRIKGPRGDQFFINRESVERYAEELKQIEAVASIGTEPRHGALQHATARQSAPERANTPPPPAAEPEHAHAAESEYVETIKRLEGELLNLRIDNRAKEQVITMLDGERRDMHSQLRDISYRLGAAESRVAQLEAPKRDDDTARQTEPEQTVDAVVVPEPPPETTAEPAQPAAEPEQNSAPRRSFFGRLLG
jgi:hypothetical protein